MARQVRCGWFGRGVARSGKAGEVWFGRARLGKVRQARQGGVRYGEVWHGMARCVN